MSRRKLYKEFSILDVKNDIVKRDLFWYAICDKFGIDLGELVWYDVRARELFLNSPVLPDKIKKYFRRDSKIQVGKLYGERKQSRTHKIPTAARIVNPAYPTFSWFRPLLERGTA